MGIKEFPYIYPYSFSEAKRLNELDRWKISHKENGEHHEDRDSTCQSVKVTC